MNTEFLHVRWLRSLVLFTGWILMGSALAYPPAPHQLVYGLVRDEQGNPLANSEAEVLLEVEGAILARTIIAPGVEPGVNYRLAIPLDSGVTADLYAPTALRPTSPFRMRVKIGNVNYLPIEMTGVAHLLTRPGESSRVDLTLGVDSDGDGLPDAWELALIAVLGGGKTLADIRPGDDADGDGLSNLQEYLAGTYAFDPVDGFSLEIVGTVEGRSLLEFTAIRGRSYTIHASHELQTWSPVAFSLSTDAGGTPPRQVYQATNTRILRPWVVPLEDNESAPRFFKLLVH